MIVKVKVKVNACAIDASKTPPHLGYTQHHMDWRKSLSTMQGKEYTVKMELSSSYNLQHQDGFTIGISKDLCDVL